MTGKTWIGPNRTRSPIGAGSVPFGACSVPVRFPPLKAWSPPVPAPFPLVPARCWLGSRRCRLGAGSVLARFPPVPAQFPFTQIGSSLPRSVPAFPARFPFTQIARFPFIQLGTRLPDLVYPDQVSSTPKGSISIDFQKLRLHPSNTSIFWLPPLPRTLHGHLCAIVVQRLQRANRHIITTVRISKGVLGSTPSNVLFPKSLICERKFQNQTL